MPLRPDDPSFLPQLYRHKNAGVTFVMLNVYFDLYPPETAFTMLASLRRWVSAHGEDFVLADTVADIEEAKSTGRLAIAFDIEGGRAVEAHPGLVEVFYRLGVRWMLIAYNRNNRLGGGCQDADQGLTAYGRQVIDEMERVGMVLCCSHTGYRTSREAIAYSRNPVIFSHSNPSALHEHPRNVPDQLIKACAATGGVINLNGIGIFLGENDASVETFIRHVDYVAQLVGAAHVGLGLDFIFDRQELDDLILSKPELFPADRYGTGIRMIEPERIPEIADGLLRRGWTDTEVQGVLGANNLRVARQVWR
jgi:membrane dipeptidase